MNRHDRKTFKAMGVPRPAGRAEIEDFGEDLSRIASAARFATVQAAPQATLRVKRWRKRDERRGAKCPGAAKCRADHTALTSSS